MTIQKNIISTLSWAKSHVGNKGNEKADEQVKDTTRKSNIHWYFLYSNKWMKESCKQIKL